jgi:hypothetical protein
MAKRKTDPEGTTAPSRRRKSTTDAIPATSATPKVTRARLKSDTAVVQAAAAATVPTADAGGLEIQAVSLHGEGVQVPHEQIAVRAYHLYLERGGRGGDPVSDWVRAERELRQQRAQVRH